MSIGSLSDSRRDAERGLYVLLRSLRVCVVRIRFVKDVGRSCSEALGVSAAQTLEVSFVQSENETSRRLNFSLAKTFGLRYQKVRILFTTQKATHAIKTTREDALHVQEA
jgi:hypothetical protein